ncbi:MAG: hypothetical protein ACYTHJ_17100 [Planctomycetota bacterium]|jgi:hypothetical protein
MVKRGLALGLVLGVASVAMAEVSVELRPNSAGSEFNLCGQYGPNETVTYDIYVTQNGGSDLLIRMVKLDFSVGDISFDSITWDGAGADLSYHYQWESGAAAAVVYAGPLPPNPAPGPGDLGPNPAAQYNLLGTGEVRVGELTITTPASGTANLTANAAVHWGFGLDDGPITSEASVASQSLTIGAQNLVTSAPVFESTLWRSANHVVRLSFDTSFSAPAAGQIEIVQLQAGGVTGADVSGSFTFTAEAGDVLRIAGSGLTNGTWYEIRNLGGWGDVGPFRVQYQVALGDANADGRVLPNDLSAINSGVPTVGGPDDNRFDINGDLNVLPNDLSIANSNIPYLGVAKPTGHDCE